MVLILGWSEVITGNAIHDSTGPRIEEILQERRDITSWISVKKFFMSL